MKRGDAVNLFYILKDIKLENDMSVWEFSVKRNLITLKPEAEYFEKIREEMNQERIRVAELYCDKDESGNPLLEKNAEGDLENYKMSSEGIHKFNIEFKKKIEEVNNIFSVDLLNLVLCIPSENDIPKEYSDELRKKLDIMIKK